MHLPGWIGPGGGLAAKVRHDVLVSVPQNHRRHKRAGAVHRGSVGRWKAVQAVCCLAPWRPPAPRMYQKNQVPEVGDRPPPDTPPPPGTRLPAPSHRHHPYTLVVTEE